jgi:hypothetical protein
VETHTKGDPVKTVCAWCGATIEVRCEHCGENLVTARAIGGTFGFYGDAMVCLNGETPVIYTEFALQRMNQTHGICESCSRLPSTERDARLTERRLALAPRERAALPSAADLDVIADESRIAEATKKRGPTGVTRSATRRAEIDGEKR